MGETTDFFLRKENIYGIKSKTEQKYKKLNDFTCIGREEKTEAMKLNIKVEN